MSDTPVRPVPLSTTAAARRVFDLSFGEMLWSRRTIFMALVVGGPVVLGLIFRIFESLGVPALRVNGTRVMGASAFGGMVWVLYVRFIVPVLGLFYGTALMADEVEDRTITYLFTRPIPRGAVLLGKYLAYLACTSLVVLPSVMLTYFLLVPLGQVAASFRSLVLDLGILAVGLATYGAVFALVGARFKRPLVSGLLFAFGWEQFALALPGYLRQFTVAYHLQALVPHAMPADSALQAIQGFFRQTTSPLNALAWLALLLVGALWLAMRTVSRREYVLEQ
ncbi:MAG: ABC transporter permease [Vicinamibacterales bacterium]